MRPVTSQSLNTLTLYALHGVRKHRVKFLLGDTSMEKVWADEKGSL